MIRPAWRCALQRAELGTRRAIVALFAKVARKALDRDRVSRSDVAGYDATSQRPARPPDGRLVAHDDRARIVGQVSAHDLERDEPQLGMVVAGSHAGAASAAR